MVQFAQKCVKSSWCHAVTNKNESLWAISATDFLPHSSLLLCHDNSFPHVLAVETVTVSLELTIKASKAMIILTISTFDPVFFAIAYFCLHTLWRVVEMRPGSEYVCNQPLCQDHCILKWTVTFNLSKGWQHDYGLYSLDLTYAKKLGCTYAMSMDNPGNPGYANANVIGQSWSCEPAFSASGLS